MQENWSVRLMPVSLHRVPFMAHSMWMRSGRIDAGECTANEAFQHAGVNFSLPEKERMRSVAMFAAMECAALLLLNTRARIALAGSLAPAIAPEVKTLLGRDVAVFDEWCASKGLVRIARDVFCGKKEILGLDVDL